MSANPLPEDILVAINADLLARGLAVLTDDQMECLNAPDRYSEALALLDDLEARCGISSNARADAADFLRERDEHYCEECERSNGPHYRGTCEHGS